MHTHTAPRCRQRRFRLAVTTHAAARVQHPAMPPGMTHEEHLAQMQKDDDLKKRGAEAMGFDQDKTAHHFRLSRAGGAIEVTVKRRPTSTLLEQVRIHLQAIAARLRPRRFRQADGHARRTAARSGRDAATPAARDLPLRGATRRRPRPDRCRRRGGGRRRSRVPALSDSRARHWRYVKRFKVIRVDLNIDCVRHTVDVNADVDGRSLLRADAAAAAGADRGR